MIGVFRRFLVAKLALVVLTAVLLGMAGTAAVNAHMQLKTMERMQRESASALAMGLAAGVRNAMLTGNGIAVRELLADAKQGIRKASVQIYSTGGQEVFGEKPPAPPLEALPAHVRAVLETKETADAPGPARSYPIPSEMRCQKCHAEAPLRGVFTLGTSGARVPWAGEGAHEVLSQTARAAFVQIMTGRRETRVDEFFAELAKRTPGVLGIAVYSSDGEQFFGSSELAVPEDVLKRGLAKGPPFTAADGDRKLRVVPLENEPRCKGCHDPKEPMRGALVMALDESKLEGERSLMAASVTSLQHVMLSGLGRLINGFLDEVAETGVVSTLTLHDEAGRLYHDPFAETSPPPLVGDVLASGETVMAVHDEGAATDFVYVDPLANEERCQTCHGTDQKLRGAIAITLDTSEEAREVADLRERSLAFAGLTVALVVLLLWWGLRYTVLRPVRVIGGVADSIGEGRLDVKVELETLDEMGRLAGRINDMTAGLRQKLELSKFVSKATLETVHQEGTVDRGGMRRRLTVLFSDIRGFTAFSETRQPEEVVDMLNTYLQVQSEVVHKYGGDIDKFVGDELMARFDGEGHALRAVAAAVEMVEAVERQNALRPPEAAMAIGIGINTGDMVLGAMGSTDRMDFTVIGDAVNLGARLCSAAQRNQVIVSDATSRELPELGDLALEPLEPIKVKGKVEPISIYLAIRRPPPPEHHAGPDRRPTLAYFMEPFSLPKVDDGRPQPPR